MSTANIPRSPRWALSWPFCTAYCDSSIFNGGGTGWPRRIRCRRSSWLRVRSPGCCPSPLPRPLILSLALPRSLWGERHLHRREHRLPPAHPLQPLELAQRAVQAPLQTSLVPSELLQLRPSGCESGMPWPSGSSRGDSRRTTNATPSYNLTRWPGQSELEPRARLA